jgi:hypothetical protein
MIAVIVTAVTSVLEIIDTLWGSNWMDFKDTIEIFLAAITPLLVWLLPMVPWVRKFPE